MAVTISPTAITHNNGSVQDVASCGVGQSWQNVTRSIATWYQNTTGKPIMVTARSGTGGDCSPRVGPTTANYVQWNFEDGDSGTFNLGSFIVPNDHYYMILDGVLRHWLEMR